VMADNGLLGFKIKRTFLEFDDGIQRSGTALARSHSADTLISSSGSRCSGGSLSSSKEPALRHRVRTREELAVESSSSEAGVQLQRPHIVWSTPSNTSSSSVGDGDRRQPLQKEVNDDDGWSSDSMLSDHEPFFRGNKNVVSLPPSDDTATHPSVGSATHSINLCRPCHYIQTKSGCKLEESCKFCHYRHARRSTSDVSKSERKQCQNFVRLVHQDLPLSEGRLAGEKQLLEWMSQDDRIGAYAYRVLRCFQGAHLEDSCAEQFVEVASAVRQGRVRNGGDGTTTTIEEPPTPPPYAVAATANKPRSDTASSSSWCRVSL